MIIVPFPVDLSSPFAGERPMMTTTTSAEDGIVSTGFKAIVKAKKLPWSKTLRQFNFICSSYHKNTKLAHISFKQSLELFLFYNLFPFVDKVWVIN